MNIQNLIPDTDKIILASASPRRRELLGMIGINAQIIPSDCDENVPQTEPSLMVKAIAEKKARAVADKFPNQTVIGADTIVVLDGQVFGKPKDSADAENMLTALSGHVHSVYTGVCIITKNGKCLTNSVKTDVYFKHLGKDEIQTYVQTGEPMDKAGAYAVQGVGSIFVEKIDGDFFNVVGLPVSTVYTMLKQNS